MRTLEEFIVGPNKFNLNNLFCFPQHYENLNLSAQKRYCYEEFYSRIELSSAQLKAHHVCLLT